MALLLEKKGRIAYITLNRAEALNSLDPETWDELGDAFVDYRDDPEMRCAIVTGAGNRAFCTGADISGMLPHLKKYWHDDRVWYRTIMRGLEVRKPIIAAVNGHALGGGLELAVACDFRIASDNATFGNPEIKLGIIPGWGATQRLPRLVPLAKAAEMIMLGDSINAEEAYRIGLVNKVVTREELMPTAQEWAEKLCNLPPLALQAAKEAINRGRETNIETGLRLERRLFGELLHNEDYEEGVKAFSERRKPDFKGK